MKKTNQLILSASLIAAFMLFVFYEKQSNARDTALSANPLSGTSRANLGSATEVIPNSDTVSENSLPKESASSALTAKPVVVTAVPAPAPSVAPIKGQFKNGTFVGKVTDAYFGPLQVSAVISGGKLTDVKFLKYPNDQHESLEISNRSLPKLKNEAITSQRAKVDIISGATQTSEAFNESLGDALSLAKA